MSGSIDHEGQPQDEPVVRFPDDLQIGSETTEITDEEALAEHMDITRKFVEKAISDREKGITSPPVEDVGEVFSYMERTHRLEFTFSQPEGNPESLLAEAFADSATDFEELEGLLASNDEPVVPIEKQSELTQEIMDLIDEDEIEGKEDLARQVMAKTLPVLLNMFAKNPTDHELAKMEGFLPAELFELARAEIRIRRGNDSSFDFAEREKELAKGSLNTAAWHREEQFRHTSLYYIMRDEAWGLINTGHTEAGKALLGRAVTHHTLKYEHMGVAIQLERDALGIEQNFVPNWMLNTKRALLARSNREQD